MTAPRLAARRLAAGLVASGLLAGCAATRPAGAAGSSVGLPQRAANPSLAAAADLAPCPASTAPAVHGGLPTVRLPCLGSAGKVDLAGLRGPALVNVWASDCGPCREEAPALQALHAHAGGRLLVLGVDFEPQPDAGLQFAIHEGLHYPMVSDEHGALLDAGLAVRGLPMTLFVDRAGRIVARHYGALPGGVALAALVRDRLGVQLP